MFFISALATLAQDPPESLLASRSTAAAAAGCSTSQYHTNCNWNNNFNLGKFGATNVAYEFYNSSAVTMCSVWLTNVIKTGTPTGNLTCSVWTTNGAPNGAGMIPLSLVGTWSDAFDVSTLSATLGTGTTNIHLVNFSASLSAATSYWLVFTYLNGDNTDYVIIATGNFPTATDAESNLAYNSGPPWLWYQNKDIAVQLLSQ